MNAAKTRLRCRSWSLQPIPADWRAKAVALDAVQALSGTARDVLHVYAMTGSAVANIAIVAAPHIEMLLRCIFHDADRLAAVRPLPAE